MNSPWLDPAQPLRTPPRMPYAAGGVLLFVAVGSLLIGGFLFAVGLGWIRMAALGNGPRWLLALFGCSAFMGGLLLAVRAAHTHWQRARCAAATTSWQQDFPWPEDGILSDARPASLVFDLLGLGALLPFLLLLNGAALREVAIAPFFVWLILGLLDLLALGGMASLLRRAGSSHEIRLTLERSPVVPGTRLTGTLEPLPGHVVTCEMRGISESATWNRVGTNAPKIKTRVFYRQSLGTQPVTNGQARIDVEMPANAVPTKLYAPPLTYWELVVCSGNVERVILLPVYPDP
jgi:hypothetical protein